MRTLLIRSLLLSLATAASVAVVPTAVEAADAADAAATVSRRAGDFVKTDKSCNYKRYHNHFTVRVKRNAPLVTHVSNYVFGPHYDRTVTKSSKFNDRATSGWHADATVKAESGGLSKLVAKAEVTIGGGYQKSTSHTSTSSLTVRDHITNPTNRNQQWVFYKGVMFAKGQYRWYQCHQFYVDGQSYGYFRVVYYPGSWRTYAVDGGGAASCSAGTAGLGRIAKAAMRIGCKA